MTTEGSIGTAPEAPAALHRVWRLPADVDTDAIAPGATMKFAIDVAARHCLEGMRPEFAAQVGRGDVIVAGANFGIGSSREQAVAVLLHLGVAAVVAPSFSGLYLRNALNLGLLVLTCDEAQQLQEGERIAIDARAGRILRERGEPLDCERIPDFLLAMVQGGGLLEQLRHRTRKESR